MAPVAPRKPTNDAKAICTAVTQPTMRFVSVKTEAQQAVLMSHRARDFLVRQLTQPGKPQSRRRIHGRTRPVAEDADPLVTREPSIHGPRTMANALRRRGSLLVWLDKEMAWLAHAKEDLEGRRCSQMRRSRSACRSRVKGARKTVLRTVFSPEKAEPRFRPPLGQTAGMVASLLRLAGLDGPVPDCSTLCRRQESLAVHSRAAAPTAR